MNLEYARKATKKEVEDFYNFIRKKQDDKIELAQQCLEDYGFKLINEYHEIAYRLDNKFQERKKELAYARECFREQKCECGLKLKPFTNRQTGQQFLGCPDYMNGEITHRAWNHDPSDNFNGIFDNWLGKIINTFGLKGRLHTKYLMKFYEENGLKDLQLEYTGKSSYDLIDRYTNINSKQKAFELRQVEFLRNQWPNVIYQFPVKYKYTGEKEKMCFIDILCSDDETICIYECKTNRYNIDTAQMNLYVDVIKYINSHLKINKILKIDYLTEE